MLWNVHLDFSVLDKCQLSAEVVSLVLIRSKSFKGVSHVACLHHVEVQSPCWISCSDRREAFVNCQYL